MPSWPRSRARKLGAFPFLINAGEGPATAAAGEWPCLPTPTPAPERRTAAAEALR
jgi:hypothetical protein